MNVAIFVDGSNMFYAQRKQGWDIDYEKVYNHFQGDKILVGAYYFAAYRKDKYQPHERFKRFLIQVGYKVIDKPVHSIKDEKTGNIIQKGNLDIELCFRMLTTYHKWDEAVLLGVDVDFIPIIKHLQQLSKTVNVVGNKRMTSLEMINCADKFIDLEKIRLNIERQHKK